MVLFSIWNVYINVTVQMVLQIGFIIFINKIGFDHKNLPNHLLYIFGKHFLFLIIAVVVCPVFSLLHTFRRYLQDIH